MRDDDTDDDIRLRDDDTDDDIRLRDDDTDDDIRLRRRADGGLRSDPNPPALHHRLRRRQRLRHTDTTWEQHRLRRRQRLRHADAPLDHLRLRRAPSTWRRLLTPATVEETVELFTPWGASAVCFAHGAQATVVSVDNLFVARGERAVLERAVCASDDELAACEMTEAQRAQSQRLRAELSQPAPTPPARLGPVTQLNIGNTQRCNLRCAYCYNHLTAAAADGLNPASMTPQTARRAVDALLAQSADEPLLSLVFIGGESLVQKRLVMETITYAERRFAERGKQLDAVVYTNGVLMDADVVAWANDHSVSLVVSLDGPPALHDRFRRDAAGEATSTRVLANIRYLVEHARLPLRRVRSVASEPGDLLPLHEYLFDLGFNDIQVQPAYGADGMGGRDRITDLEPLLRWYGALLTAGVVISIQPYVTILERLTGRGAAAVNWYPCGVGMGTLGVTPGGDLCPCHHFLGEAEPRLGNLRDGIPGPERRATLAIPTAARPACSACWARALCGGECYHRAVTAGRGYAGVVPEACVERRATIRAAVETFTQVAARRPHVIRDLLDQALTDVAPNPRAFELDDLGPYRG